MPFKRTFANSSNVLEIAVGLASAFATSSLYGTKYFTAGTLSLEIHGDESCENVRRLGLGNKFSPYVAIVSLFDFVLVVCIICFTLIQQGDKESTQAHGSLKARVIVCWRYTAKDS
jgi:hypothetical protein